jgi:PIN domain nuclease of toxin-antitoxin system
MESSGAAPLPIQHSHALHAGALPRHHADPFDRLLIAQAQMENLAILTADAQFEAYEVTVLWV